MIIFAFVPEWGLPAIVVAGAMQGLSAALYDLCHMIDFSKVKSVDHAGKEIAYMNIVEKIATGLSPLIGGMLAFVAGPQTTMLAAGLLMAVTLGLAFHFQLHLARVLARNGVGALIEVEDALRVRLLRLLHRDVGLERDDGVIRLVRLDVDLEGD